MWIHLILSEPTQNNQRKITFFGQFFGQFWVKRFLTFEKTGKNTMRIMRIFKLYFLRSLKLSFNKIFYETEKLLFSSERAQSADSGAIFSFKIEER